MPRVNPEYPAPPYPVFPPPPPLVPEQRWNGKTNGFSIAALTLALLGCSFIVSLVLGIIGLNQSRRNGDKRGKVFAIIALVIAGAWMLTILTAVGIAIARDVADGPDRDDTGAIRGEREITLTSMRPGDCVKDLESEEGSRVHVLPCSSPHSSELFATYDLPKDATDQKTAQAGCEKRFEAYAGKKKTDDAGYILFSARMSDVGSPSDRGVLCFAHNLHGPTTGSLRHS